MTLDPAELSIADAYKLLIGAIVPRPIALVSTISTRGELNLAPFSFFAGVSANPMTVLFCPANTSEGLEKDTLRNAKPERDGGTGQFVVNIVDEPMARAMAACAEPLPHGESEFGLSGLTPGASIRVRPPRVAQSPISLECATLDVVRLNPGAPSGGNIVIGRVVVVHAREGLVNDRFHVDPGRLAAIGRMGGPSYCTTRGRFDMPMGRGALAIPEPRMG